jgi:hypothetical protein
MKQGESRKGKAMEKKMLFDYFPTAEIIPSDDEFLIEVEGKVYQYEMTLSPAYSDEECCRVCIDNEYYYFG